jgi:hypothetical protein
MGTDHDVTVTLQEMQDFTRHLLEVPGFYRLSTDHTSRTLYSFLRSAAGLGSGETTARIRQGNLCLRKTAWWAREDSNTLSFAIKLSITRFALLAPGIVQ